MEGDEEVGDNPLPLGGELWGACSRSAPRGDFLPSRPAPTAQPNARPGGTVAGDRGHFGNAKAIQRPGTRQSHAAKSGGGRRGKLLVSRHVNTVCRVRGPWVASGRPPRPNIKCGDDLRLGLELW